MTVFQGLCTDSRKRICSPGASRFPCADNSPTEPIGSRTPFAFPKVSWQTLITDCEFDGQAKAAIRTRAVGPTLVRTRIANTPYAFYIGDGNVEQI